MEYVKAEAKILYLLQVLQKTAPPVLIFAENKKDVDDIQVRKRCTVVHYTPLTMMELAAFLRCSNRRAYTLS